MRIKDIFHRFMEPHLTDRRLNWDNGADNEIYLNATAGHYEDWELEKAHKDNMTPLEQKAHLSFEDCGAACLARGDCFQYRFHNGICGMQHSFKHGHPTPGSDNAQDRYESGWDVKNILKWVKAHDKCPPVRWPDV